MGKFKPLIPVAPRCSKFVSRLELLDILKQQTTGDRGPQKWSLCTDRGDFLVPAPTPVPRYLFRGQTQRHTPCLPSLYRHYQYPARYVHQLEADDAALIVANFARMMVFLSEIQHHPVLKWAKSERVALAFSEIAQHHGIPTPLIDLSASIDVALFFATHEYNELRGFTPRADGRGVLYIVDLERIPQVQRARFRSASIQPFARPYKQWAWSCELLMGECFEACPYLAILEFEHDLSFAHTIRERVEVQGGLFPPDLLADLAVVIRSMTTLPMQAVTQAHRHLGPAYPQHVFGPPESLLCRAGLRISEKYEPIFSTLYWKQRQPGLRASLEDWLSKIIRNRETLLVRRNRAGEPVALARFNGPLITPDAIEIIRNVAPITTVDHSNASGEAVRARSFDGSSCRPISVPVARI